MNILFVGPPGAGKGTQARLFAKLCDAAHLSAGDIIRAAIQTGDVPPEIHEIISQGKMIPDDMTLSLMVAAYQKSLDRTNIVFDGFPRNVWQAEQLSGLLAELGSAIHRVIVLEVDEDALVDRICNRRTCSSCGEIYGKDRISAWRCECGGDLETRADDIEEVIRGRFQLYRDQTLPILDHYNQKYVHRIDGMNDPETVLRHILRIPWLG